MKDMGSFTSNTNQQTYRVAAEIDNFGPRGIIAWRCGAKPIEFVFDVKGFDDPLLNAINNHVLNTVYGNLNKMPEPEDFAEALILPL